MDSLPSSPYHFAMTPRRALPFVCVLLLALLAPLRAAADNDWDLILQALRKQEQTIHVRLEAFRQHSTAMAAGQSETVERLLRERARLALWQATATDPWEIRDVIAGFARMRFDVERLAERPQQAWTSLEQNAAALETFRDRLAEITQQDVPERFRNDILPSQQTIAALGAEISAERDALAAKAGPLRQLADQIKSAEESMQTSLTPAWKSYYTQAFPTPFSLSFLYNLGLDFEDWNLWNDLCLELLHTRHNQELVLHSLILGGVFALLAAILTLVVLQVLRRKIQTPAGLLRVIAKAGACLVVGVFFLGMSRRAPFFMFTPLVSTGEILLTAALVHLSRLRRPGDHSPPRPPILWSTWRLFAVGLLVESFRMPETLMGPIMTIILAGSAFAFSRRHKFTPPQQHLDRGITRALSLLLPLLALLSLGGLPQTAILCASGLFYIALALRFAAVTTHFIGRTEVTRHHGHPPIFLGLLAGAGYPFFFLAYLFVFLWLLSTQFGGEYVFLELLSTETRIESVGISLQKLATLLAGFYLAKACIFLSDTFIRDMVGRRRGVERGATASLLTINTYAWWGLFALFAMAVLGLSLTSVAVVAGGLSVGIGFGLQTMVNNFISGLILLFGRSIQSGDTVQLGDSWGVVKEVNIRNTEVLTLENATVFVPNSELVSGKIVNWSHKDPSVRRDICVGVAYGSDIAAVRRLLLQAAAACPAVLANPAPSVLHWDFGPSTLDFRLRVWLADVDGAVTAMSGIRETIDTLFREAEIEIAFPQTDVHLRSAPALEKIVERHMTAVQQQLTAIADRLSTLENNTRASQAPDAGEQ